ncbi:MAG: acetate kinase [Phycisphaerae bacterium]|nr:acetate kinase [Phycisphaerae bacterium]
MKILVINCGSSSVKYKLFDVADGDGAAVPHTPAAGVLERVGGDAVLHHTAGEATDDRRVDAPDHRAAIGAVLDALVHGDGAVLDRLDTIDGVGHRVVHGGEDVTDASVADDALREIIRRNASLAPLHNPPNLDGIDAAREALPEACHVAVFDTAFLTTLPPKAYRYAVPERWYREHHVRKYGFHGTSHRYVTLRTAELLSKPVAETNLITCHLGNGCSMTAVAGGKAVDHSMGMTPLDGLVMGTRSGTLDPAVVLYMLSRGLDREAVGRALNAESGLLALSGRSNDMRDLLAARDDGDERAALAVEAFIYRVVKYVGAYHLALRSVDAVVLTGGIGENSIPARRGIVDGLAPLGAVLDADRNASLAGSAGAITTAASSLSVWVVPTDEEFMIARDTARFVSGRQRENR